MKRTKRKEKTGGYTNNDKNTFGNWPEVIRSMENTPLFPTVTASPIGRVMACDPSMTAFGWVVLDFQRNILESGCIKTESESKKLRIRKGDDTIRRITEMVETIVNLIDKYHVIHIVSELPHGSQSASAADMLGIVKGIVQTISVCKKIGIEWYSEGDSKKALHGDGKKTISKADTIKAINKLYTVPWTCAKFRNEAIADALAVHHVATIQSPVLKLFGNG